MKYYVITLLLIVITSLNSTAQDVDTFLNDWHQAAADANAELYFKAIAEDGIYIGTDATERWNKEEFKAFAKPYFDKGEAWDFTPYDRQLHFTKDQKLVWFSELLKTWMGVCRGSGILVKRNNQWQIVQYHLSVTLPNDQIDDFISLINKKQ